MTGNAAYHGSGGGLCSEAPGMLSILRTTVRGNDAAYQGAGVNHRRTVLQHREADMNWEIKSMPTWTAPARRISSDGTN